MPQTYVQVPNKNQSHGYSIFENLIAAARDVKTNKLSYRVAAEKHDVKRTTLYERFYFRCGKKVKELGRKHMHAFFFIRNDKMTSSTRSFLIFTPFLVAKIS